MASTAYSRDYRDWIAGGNFERICESGRDNVASAINSRRPDLLAPALRDIALAYYMRGAVCLMDGEPLGWHDIQCGYAATVYALRVAAPLLTGLEADVRESPDYIVQAVMTLGLARLFSTASDESFLRRWLDSRYDVVGLTGKVASGRCLLDSIYLQRHELTVDRLRQDRKECCRKRSVWPKRATEVEPFGVLDVELAINYPSEAEFPYPAIEYRPTADYMVIRGISAYQEWNN